MNSQHSSDEVHACARMSKPAVSSKSYDRMPLNSTRLAVVVFLCFVTAILSGCQFGSTAVSLGLAKLSDIKITVDMSPEARATAEEINRTIRDFNEHGINVGAETIEQLDKFNAAIEKLNGEIASYGVLGEEGVAALEKAIAILDKGLDVGLDRATLDALDEFADFIDRQPDKWGDQAEKLVQLLNMLGTETAANLAREVDDTRRQIVADTEGLIRVMGEQARCTIDFTGQQADLTVSQAGGKFMAGLLPFTADYYERNKSIPPKIPVVCTISPDSLELVWRDGKLEPGTGSEVVNVSGFNFSVDQMPSVSLRSDDGKTQYSVPLLAHPTSAYQLTVNLTGKQYGDIVNPVGLVFEWPDTMPDSRFYKVVKVESAPVAIAGFSADITSGDAPLSVAFTDRSSGEPTSFRWNFGDMTPISTLPGPTHTYQNPGVYAVRLTVSNRFSKPNTLAIPNFITVTVPPVSQPNFGVSDQRQGPAPLSVQFEDLSGPDIVRREWDFGDGSPSREKNPLHRFSKPGTYSIRLTVWNKFGASAFKEEIDYIVAQLPPATADFEATGLTGPAPLTVSFHDKSGGNPSIWRWDFGDGQTSDQPSPSHTYKFPGSFTVRLIVTNQDGVPSVPAEPAYVVASPKMPSPPVATRVSVSGPVRVTDINESDVPGWLGGGLFDNAEEVSDGTIEWTFVLTPEHLQDTFHWSLCAGDEARAELDLRSFMEPTKGEVQISGEAKLYEGESCANDGLGDRSAANADIPPDGVRDLDISLEIAANAKARFDLKASNSRLDSTLYPLDLKNMGSGKYMAVVCAAAGYIGHGIQRMDCTAVDKVVEQSNSRNWGSASWKIHWLDPTAGVAEIVHVASGGCLEVAGGSMADEAGIRQSTCTGSDNQRWMLHDLGDGGGIVIVNQRSSKCLEVANASTADHARLQQFQCRGSNNQRWNLGYNWP